MAKKSAWPVPRAIAPAIAVLLSLFFLSHSSDSHALVGGWEVVLRVLFRCFRFTLLLCLPLYWLLPTSAFFVRSLRRNLLQTNEIGELSIAPMKHLVFRPFQGIGIGLLFETKLLAVLQIVTGGTAEPFLLIHRGQLQLGRMLVVSGITVMVSFLLSTLWTLDDAGIRYVNQKDQEVKMIGKYVGTLMPIIFGFYGIISLIAAFPTGHVLSYLLKTILILYSPFSFFAVLHARLLRRKVTSFSERISLRKGGVWLNP